MTRSRKTTSEATLLGQTLRSRRKELGLTLSKVAQEVHIDVGQLSRFERGDFIFVSPNLEVIINFLQIFDQSTNEGGQEKLLKRFEAVLTRSARHEDAARALVAALESLR
jgi:transcriptional regulator with XRE-family HTH domain